ncbi:MAG TPA: hypothetical protein VKE74_01155, partial [Gemmataceae bacterium]|nr:hypothetical protein [Gemmataceae bacterium]
DNWYVHDYQRASSFMAAWAYLREGQRFELDSEGEPTCLVMGRLRAQEIEEIRRQTEAAEEPALEPPHSHPVPPPIRTEKGEGGAPKPSAGRATRDPNQPARDRQNDILATIRNAGSPQTRPELIKAMRLKSEGKLGAHLAWMVKNKILINIPRQGYWPAGEPVPE